VTEDSQSNWYSKWGHFSVALGVIQTFVGHMSARMVRHYTHVSSGAARKAVELLDSDPILTPSAEEKIYRA